MANIQAPNYSQIPNIVIDAMTEYTEPELRVLLVVCRQTFGWHRERATLSISFFQQATGLSKTAIVNATKSLTERNIVEKTAGEGTAPTNVFKLVVQGEGVPTTLTGGANDVDRGSPLRLQGGANDVDTKKERIKETGKEKKKVIIPASLGTPEFLTAWGEWLEDRKARNKPITPLAASKQLAKLEAWGVEKACAAIDMAIEKGWQGLFEPKGFKTSGATAATTINPFADFTQ